MFSVQRICQVKCRTSVGPLLCCNIHLTVTQVSWFFFSAFLRSYNLDSGIWNTVPVNSGPVPRYGHSLAAHQVNAHTWSWDSPLFAQRRDRNTAVLRGSREISCGEESVQFCTNKRGTFFEEIAFLNFRCFPPNGKRRIYLAGRFIKQTAR